MNFKLWGAPDAPAYEKWKQNRPVKWVTLLYYFFIGLLVTSFFIHELKTISYLGVYIAILIHTVMLFTSPPPIWPIALFFRRLVGVCIVLFFGIVIYASVFPHQFS